MPRTRSRLATGAPVTGVPLGECDAADFLGLVGSKKADKMNVNRRLGRTSPCGTKGFSYPFRDTIL